MQDEFTQNILKEEETINFMQTKKRIIQENILEKEMQRKIKNKKIQTILTSMEKELDRYNVDKISINNYRKDITNVNDRIRSLLSSENHIFKNNKIKIYFSPYIGCPVIYQKKYMLNKYYLN